MKKYVIIALIGITFLILIGLIIKRNFDIVDLEKAISVYKQERDQAWKTAELWERENMEFIKTKNKQENRLVAGTLQNSALSTVKEEDTLGSWFGDIDKLKSFIEQHPQYSIPEFKYLTDKDWLKVAERGPFKTEADYRKALAQLRSYAKGHTVQMFVGAISAFSRENNGNRPQDYEDIIPYLPKDFDYSRYIGVPARDNDQHAGNSQTQWKITDVGPVDGIWDSRMELGVNPISYSQHSINTDAERVVRSAVVAFEKEKGSAPTSYNQIIEYIGQNAELNAADASEVFKCITTPIE